MQLIQSGQRSTLCYQRMYWQFGHRKLQVVVSYIAIVDVGFGVFKIVAPHLGVLVVDWVDEEKDDRDGDDCDSHKSSYEGKVVLCNEIKQATYF